MVLIWACLLLASAGAYAGYTGDWYLIDGVYVECDCSYKFYHGCKIIDAAPTGFACHCVYVGFWTCKGIPRKCDKDDWCPADDFSHESCMKGAALAEQNKLPTRDYNCNGVEN